MRAGQLTITDDAPPWREITTDDYLPRTLPDALGGKAWITSAERIRELLKAPYDDDCRLCLVLREAVDYQEHPRHPPAWWGHCSHGLDLILAGAEIHIERWNGRRYRVDRRATINEAMVAKPVPRG